VLGLLLGFVSRLAFWALSMAGEIFGMQMGWGFAGMLHPSLDQSPIVSGQFLTIIGTLLFLSIGGHHMALLALSNTFTVAPPYSFTVEGIQIGRVVQMTASLLASALQLAIPIVGTLMLTEVVLAFLSRVMPRMNAWVFGMPLKVGIGLITLLIALPAILALASRWLAEAPLNMLALLR